MTEPSANTITFSHTSNAWKTNGTPMTYVKDTGQTVSGTSVFYERSDGNGAYGLELKYENGITTAYANSSNNSNEPFLLRKNEGAAATSISLAGFNGTTDKLQGLSTSDVNTAGTSFTFVVTSDHLWTAATGSEGSSAPSGSKLLNSSGQLVFTVDSGSPTSDGTIAYKIFAGTVGNMVQQYVVSHNSAASTDYNVGDPSTYARWELRLESSSGLYNSAVLASHTTTKRAFCNFW